jgi:hypothetical protein
VLGESAFCGVKCYIMLGFACVTQAVSPVCVSGPFTFRGVLFDALVFSLADNGPDALVVPEPPLASTRLSPQNSTEEENTLGIASEPLS